MKAVFLDSGTFGSNSPSKVFRSLPLQWEYFDHIAPGETVQRLKGTAIAVTNKSPIREETIRALPDLKLIAITATGYNCVDTAAAKRAGIAVCNVPAYATASVAQLTIFFLLALAGKYGLYIDAVKKGEWSRRPFFCFLDFPIAEVKGKTLGIIGYGSIGQEVGRIAEAFGMTVLPLARRGNGAKLPEVLQASDFLTIHAPLTPETANMIGEKEIAMMKKTACIINVSRGGIVNENALAAALKGGRIAGAALDVLTQEPPPKDHPLLSVPNLLLTPHIGWASLEAQQALLEATRDNIAAFLAGTPKNVVS